jgi:hypothetical protein
MVVGTVHIRRKTRGNNMTKEAVFEQILIQPELDEVFLKNSTPEFWDFWIQTFGKPKKTDDKRDYWDKCSFVLIGYLGATKRINSLEANNTVDQEEFDRMMENRDEIQEQMTQLRLILKNIESLTQADNKEGVLKLIKSVDINK